MRVAIVVDELDRCRGGMGQWSWQFVTSIVRLGYEVHVVSQGFGGETLPSQIVCHKITKTNSRLAFAEAAAQVVRWLEFDVVHDMGTGSFCDILQPHGGSHRAWLARRLDMYSPGWRAVKRQIDKFLPRYRDFAQHCQGQSVACQQADKTIIALSNMVAEDFVRFDRIPQKQIAVVYNGVDCQRFSPDYRSLFRQPLRRELGVDDQTMLLLLAAHNFRLKGVPALLKLTARLVANRRAVHVMIAGGKRLEKWRRTAARLGLAEHVTFVGTVPDLVPYYSAADAFVHPTYYDPCSLVLLEAAASGLPIVTTRRCNGAAELFREGDEILTTADASDVDALYERVNALFDERLRTKLGRAARNVAMRHPFEKNVDEILRLYNKVAGRKLAA